MDKYVQKTNIREIMRRQRDALSVKQVKTDSRVITEKLLDLPQIKNAQTICTYISVGSEVWTGACLEAFFAHKKRVVAPRIQKDTLVLHEILSYDDLTMGTLSIYEPNKSCTVIPKERIDVFVVPGIAFDAKGMRVGYGRGYYDRLLSGIGVPRIGLAFSFQIVSDIEQMSYDVSVTHVVTEKNIIVIH